MRHILKLTLMISASFKNDVFNYNFAIQISNFSDLIIHYNNTNTLAIVVKLKIQLNINCKYLFNKSSDNAVFVRLFLFVFFNVLFIVRMMIK